MLPTPPIMIAQKEMVKLLLCLHQNALGPLGVLLLPPLLGLFVFVSFFGNRYDLPSYTSAARKVHPVNR